MATIHKSNHHLVDKAIERVIGKFPSEQARRIEIFTRQYYQQVAPEDLAERSVLDLYGAALAHWNLLHRRTPGERILHIYNPRMEEHGWQSTHTIIEIVHDDMPFLVDSTSMELNRLGLTVHLVIHPVIRVKRNEQCTITSILDHGVKTEDASHEAILHIEVDRQASDTMLQTLEDRLTRVLDDVRAAVADWPKMCERLRFIIGEIRNQPPPLDPGDLEEDLAFLDWVGRDHFTFLGFREYSLGPEGEEDILRIVPGSGLGILQSHAQEATSQSFAHLPANIRKLARKPGLLVITKSSSRATVHRPGYLDYLGIKRFDESGTVVGEWRFLGLYTSAAYMSRPKDIPLLRRKQQNIMKKSGFRAHSHSAKALINILETLPRDELFQSSEDELHAAATAILHLQERQRVRLLVRQDPYGRFMSCLVYIPRERFNTEVRTHIQQILKETFNAISIEFTVALSESVLARIYFIAHTEPGSLPKYDVDDIEQQILDVTRSWEDECLASLLQELGEEQGNRLFTRYRYAFPASYREDYPPPVAVADIQKMEALTSTDDLGMTIYRPLEMPEDIVRFKLFRIGNPVHLSTVLPMLENMGVRVIDERPHHVKPANSESIWVHDLGMAYEHKEQLDSEHLRHLFQDAFAQVWRGTIENDGFNRLVLMAQLPWRSVLVLRGCCKYIRQTGFPFSQHYMAQALTNHPQIACLLVDLFMARFNPDLQEQAIKRTESLIDAIEQSLDAVPNLDEDRIQRRFFTVIQSMLRTNFFQGAQESGFKEFFSFKLDPTQIPDLPEPKPTYEIFVYSPRTEGVHLRGGNVARGGIRWSDRLEDFRTEIFDLMKTQMVKNAVIVPVGAKGGFVVKQPPAEHDSDGLSNEVAYCYKTFIRGLLDLTDNLSGGKTRPPPRVVRYDHDDPYLVVAADKGTATFSDTANAIAHEYDFWLGDAFASGGSAGYDHKKMGITARGAWESVKRHFRELGIDIQSEEFSVIGIGSMNGDVFGNGMLLSRHLKLIGAFSHKHIFVDPYPDAASSYAERQRLFSLPRSTWADYDKSLISEGGGVYYRSAKSIPLSSQMRDVLKIEAESLTPNGLIRALLKAPVDLIWNGGIGTFVKAEFEDHTSVGDRANDAIRINALELRCQAFGEGGNLGLTANGRIEYARNGGRINTDFIDNSGGVDCSDHEVNIKILLDEVVKTGDLNEKQRNNLLSGMTEEVAGLVLTNNYQQTQALSLSERQAPQLLDEHARLMGVLEKSGRLERETWNLPNDEELSRRRSLNQGLSRPELAVLLSYSKINLFNELLNSDICEDDYLANELREYFPAPIHKHFEDDLIHHRLRREIIATFISNNMVNRMGITFPFRVAEHTGATAADVARAYVTARNVFELPAIWHAIEKLDNQVAANRQMDMLDTTRKLVNRATLWFLRNCRQPLVIASTVEAFRNGVTALGNRLPELLDPTEQVDLKGRAHGHLEFNVPESLAIKIASLPQLYCALDITEVSTALERDVIPVAKLYFALGAKLDLHWLRDQIAVLPDEGRWPRLARAALRDDLFRLHRTITREALLLSPPEAAHNDALTRWLNASEVTVSRYLQRLAEFKSSDSNDLALLSVAVNEARKLIQTTGAGIH